MLESRLTAPLSASAIDDMANPWAFFISQASLFYDAARFNAAFTNDLTRRVLEYSGGHLESVGNFFLVESTRSMLRDPLANAEAYSRLALFNCELLSESILGSFEQNKLLLEASKKHSISSLADAMEKLAYEYPRMIKAIEPEFGFHFQADDRVMETDSFLLYRVQPTDAVRCEGKPVLIIPPYVLGHNILGFMPKEKKSYAHAFANNMVPTYIRVMKNIENTSVQKITLEKDTLETREMTRLIHQTHGRKVTLNGYCQGGYTSLAGILSGEFDDSVDAFISCVAPMDGTKSPGLQRFLRRLPPVFNDLEYGYKHLSNGNKVASGRLMAHIYKSASIGSENPYSELVSELMMVVGGKIPKTALAIQYWLRNDRTDLPPGMTEVSFRAYNEPIKDGVLPVSWSGRKLDLKHMDMPWLICYGLGDNLVEASCALEPTRWKGDIAVSPFPKGHVAIATSHSSPDSKYPLHGTYMIDGKTHEGPIRWHKGL